MQAFLSGNSAGGSSTFFQCNHFRDRMSAHTDVKCLADAGFFMDM
jgi:hypothetical protein